MNIEFFHNTVNSIAAVSSVVETVNPVRHPAVSQNVVESIIIFSNQMGDGFVLFFCFRDVPRQPFIVCSPCNPKLPAHPVDTPVPFCIKILDCKVF